VKDDRGPGRHHEFKSSRKRLKKRLGEEKKGVPLVPTTTFFFPSNPEEKIGNIGNQLWARGPKNIKGRKNPHFGCPAKEGKKVDKLGKGRYC